MPKLAITGKGGTGKTTLAATLAHIYAQAGKEVIAIDADPAPNLALALGFPQEAMAKLSPIAQMEALIEERTGAKPGSVGGYFRANPRVDDIPERFSVLHCGVRLLVMGKVRGGGAGCLCPENALLRSLVQHLLLHREEVLIMDMEAGTENLGRATAQAVDAMLAVVEPTLRSLLVAHQIAELAGEIAIPHLFAVGNKVGSSADWDFIRARLVGIPPLGYLSLSPQAAEAEQKGIPLFDLDPRLVEEAKAIIRALEEGGTIERASASPS